jgi:hypothetical protein
MNDRAQTLRAQYLDGGGWEEIDGWLYLKALRLIDFLDKCQDTLGVRGHIGEIGLYFGKLFIFLYLLAREDEKVVGVDLFADESWEKTFHRNLARYTYPRKEPVIVKSDSAGLTSERLLDLAGGRYRLFSVDGAHAMEFALHDLRLANAVLSEGGVVLLDDYFDPKFPGVSEAVNRFLFDGTEARIAPFLICGNKMFLSTPPQHQAYREAVLAAINPDELEIHTAHFHGEPVTILI